MAVSERMKEGVAGVGHTLGADIALSGGIAMIDGKTDARAVLSAADQAMYKAKVRGNTIVAAVA
jgi:GGDEF domain-containing protein